MLFGFDAMPAKLYAHLDHTYACSLATELSRLQSSPIEANRSPDAFTPALTVYVVLIPAADVVDAVTRYPLPLPFVVFAAAAASTSFPAHGVSFTLHNAVYIIVRLVASNAIIIQYAIR